MRASERELYEQEAEIKPNRYVALALTAISFVYIAIMLLNELGVFLVVKEYMRFSTFTALVILGIPLFVTFTDSGLRDSRTKYLMIGCVNVVSAIACIVLNFHATLLLVLSMLLAAQYPSQKMSRIAVTFSILCAIVAPVIGYLTGMWDVAFIQRLCEIAGQDVLKAADGTQMDTLTAVAQILLYLSLPHAMIMVAFAPLSSAIARSGEERLKNQIQVLHMSESDALTGLLNRMSYEREIQQPVTPEDGNAAVVYVDANDLHRLNEEQGHSAGDRMLICLADSLRDAFGTENVYRTGGDEFICLLYGEELSHVRENLSKVRAQVEAEGYSISAGIEYAQPPCTLPALVLAAEMKMMNEKKAFHINR